MTEMAIRPEVVSLLLDIDYMDRGMPLRERRHRNGQLVTGAEADLVDSATEREYMAAAGYYGTIASMYADEAAKMMRFVDLCNRYSNGGHWVAEDMLAKMTPEDRAEAEQILDELLPDEFLPD